MNEKKELRMFIVLYLLVILFLIIGTRVANAQDYQSTCLYGEDTYFPARKAIDSFYIRELVYIKAMLDTCEGVVVTPRSQASYDERAAWIRRELIYLFSTEEYMVDLDIRVIIRKGEFLYYDN